MFSKQTILIFSLILLPVLGHAQISLERYSISTYVNTNAVDNTPGSLHDGSYQHDSYLHVVRVGFRQYSNPYINSSSSLTLDNRLTLLDNQDPQITGEILFFPNPFRLKTGAIISYKLSEPTNTRIEIYDMFGKKVYSVVKFAGMDGAKGGNNKLQLKPDIFNYFDVSSGVYLLFIFDDKNKLIGKSKFAVIP